jgi:hypothetical protein
VTGVIEEYVQDFRPTVLRGANSDWLFPGNNGGSKSPQLFGIQVTDRIQKTTGLRMTEFDWCDVISIGSSTVRSSRARFISSKNLSDQRTGFINQ